MLQLFLLVSLLNFLSLELSRIWDYLHEKNFVCRFCVFLLEVPNAHLSLSGKYIYVWFCCAAT